MKYIEVNKIRKIVGILILCVCFMFIAFDVYADEAKAISARTDGENIYLYIKDVSGVSGGTIQIGSSVCPKENVFVGDLDSFTIPMRTVILVDNSLSIPKANRQDIKDILVGIIDGHMQGEMFRIGTIADSVTWLSDSFSSDYTMLHACVEGLNYNDQDTYFSDCLYDAVKELAEIEDGIYSRIIVVSDGADDREIGYTNAEVSALLEESNIPVYTIGTVGNNSALETMFAFSRITNAECFLLDNIISNEDIITALLADQSMVCIKVIPDAALLDGSTKNIQISLNTDAGEVIVRTSIVMPFGTANTVEPENESEAEITEIPIEPEKETLTVTPTIPAINQNNSLPSIGSGNDDPKEKSKNIGNIRLYLIAGIAGSVFLIVLIVIILIIRGRKNKKNKMSSIPSIGPIPNMGQEEMQRMDGEVATINPCGEYKEKEETLLLNNSIAHENTMSLWGKAESNISQPRTFLVLNDLDKPAVMFKVPIIDVVRIGRKDADVVIDYDKYISAKHCEIIRRGELLSIKDLGSANGTFYENMRVYNQEMTIVSGCNIKIGQTRLKVTITKE